MSAADCPECGTGVGLPHAKDCSRASWREKFERLRGKVQVQEDVGKGVAFLLGAQAAESLPEIELGPKVLADIIERSNEATELIEALEDKVPGSSDAFYQGMLSHAFGREMARIGKQMERAAKAKMAERTLCRCGHEQGLHARNDADTGFAGCLYRSPRNVVVTCECAAFEPVK